MTIQNMIAFNVVLWTSILIPGPAFLAAIQTSLTGGRRAGIAIGCGLGLVASGWTMAALLGLDVVFTVFPWAYSAAKLTGAGYLLYIAYRMWRSAREPVAAGREIHTRRAFTRGLLVNLLNPKSVLFAAAVLIVVFPADLSMTENFVVYANHLAAELVFYTTLAFAMSSRAVSARYLRAKVVLDRVAAAVLGVFGLRLFISR